jgi:ketosteroid isomerase-like protein
MDQRLVEACSSDSRSNSRTSGPVGESVAMAKFRVGFGGPPDAARSPVVDYPGMPSAELVTAHVELLLEEAGVRDMSQENVELAARWYEPWATTSKAELLAELPRAMELCHPEVEWSQREEGRTLRGREGVREALEGWLDSFDEYRFEVWRIFDCGFDEVLVVGLEVGRGVISRAEVRSHAYELLTFRDGKIVRFRDFHDERDAFEAAGCGSSEATAHQASRCPGRPHGPIALFG